MTERYRGTEFDSAGPGRVIREPEGTILKKDHSLELRNHSPDGFQIGYSGSGQAQLALGLLLDVTDDEDLSMSLYQEFKDQVVSNLEPGWTLEVEQIEQFIEQNRVEYAVVSPDDEVVSTHTEDRDAHEALPDSEHEVCTVQRLEKDYIDTRTGDTYHDQT